MTDIGYHRAPLDEPVTDEAAMPVMLADSHDRWRLYLFAVCIPLSVFFAAAGGLGLAAMAAIMSLGAIMISGRRLLPQRRPGWPFLAFSFALAYTALTLFWSPYDKPDQGLKLLILTPLFVALPLFARRVRDISGPTIRTLYIATVTGGLILLTFEALTGGAVTQSFKLDVENYETGRVLDDAVMRSLSRGAFAMLLLAAPLVMIILSIKGKKGWYLAGPVLVMMTIISASFGVEANVVALGLGVGMAMLAWYRPTIILPALLYFSAASLLLAPFALPLIVQLPETGIGPHLPYSWEWRIEIWATVSDYISQSPLFGHGLDASRVLEPTTVLRGHEVSLLPLHAHNAALHIWLETGFVGAAFWSTTLIVLAARVRTLKLSPARSAALVGIVTAWLISVMVGFGIWQEWHHGALAIAIAGSAFIPKS